MGWLLCFRRRKANRDLALQKLKEGDVKAASELFQVPTDHPFIDDLVLGLIRVVYQELTQCFA